MTFAVQSSTSCSHQTGDLNGSSIRDVSESLGLTMRAIRIYEEMGLIECHRGNKNQRILDRTAKRRLQQIVEFKAMGFTISEIADFLHAANFRADLKSRLLQRRDMLQDQVGAITRFLDSAHEA